MSGLFRSSIAVLALMGTLPAAAQGPRSGIAGTADRTATVNFAELAAQEARAPAAIRAPKAIHRPMPGPTEPAEALPRSSAGSAIAAPTEEGTVPRSPAAASSFQALGDNNTSIPPDTNGAVGPNHLVTALNSQVRIQDKTGAVLSTVSLNSFWSSLGGPDAFDPRILYDPYGGRWIFVAAANGDSATSAVLIAVSQTGDPTGSWNLFSVDVAGTTTWADFPNVGFNKDWIVVSANMFPVGGSVFSASDIWVFTKSSLYDNASPSAPFSLFTDAGFSQVPAATYDAALATQYLVGVWSSAAGSLRISTITGTVGAETYTGGTQFTTGTSWASAGPEAPQLGSTSGAQLIDMGDSRMQKCSYRSGSLWCVHHIFLPATTPTRASVQWWQLTPAGAVQQRGRIDDPSGATFYAYPSIAVNAVNDVLIGYSRFSASQYPGANYSFRSSCDAINALQSDALLKAGEGLYYKTFGGGSNRWGDFSSTVVDPANDLDMWTLQEYAATPVATGANDGNGRWATWWGKVARQSADLGIAISDSPDPVAAGGNLTYTITVMNNGPDAVSGVSVTDVLPAGAGFVSVTPSQGTCSGTSTVVCGLGTLPNLATATVTLVVRWTPAGTASNTASVASCLLDPVAGNNSATAVTTVGNPVPVLGSLSPSSAAPGTPGMTLTVNGGNFVSGSTVNWNGTARATSFVSPGQLTATILAADIAVAGTAAVTVVNPAPAGGTSNAVSFAITSASISVNVGSGGFSAHCFIASAAYGSPMAEDVRYLRAFRDQYLLTHSSGRWLVKEYYRLSPPLAEALMAHDGWRAAVRAALSPLVALSRRIVSDETLAKQTADRP